MLQGMNSIKNYKAPNYAMFSNVLSLPLFYTQIFFATPVFKHPPSVIFPYCEKPEFHNTQKYR
jgi:hypothetical protein